MLNGKNYRPLIQSAVAFGSATLATLIFHEFAHGVTALALGYHPVVYAVHETDTATLARDVATIELSGPVASLLVGAIMLLIHAQMRGQGFARYLTLWLGVMGMAMSMGYLIVTPFYAEGDIATALTALGAGAGLLAWLALAAGIVGLIFVARLSAPCFLNLTNRDEPLRPQIYRLGLLAWLLGGCAVLLLTIPAYPLAILAVGFVAPLTGMFAIRLNRDRNDYGESGAVPQISYIGIGLLIVLAIALQMLFRTGLQL
ncbi:hypothetical protein PSQ19_14670 [Devosia algicola]|uniref:M50 family peptidase n=1 Tax=Devosia algicola TaxID=3026418 RepID=A0ABY7YLI9_9HYPH|nr:hypothetical protein [Devosia algicola]WDR01929.1 hypothetical protein PSQ19_14670 [Devosia algicola]